MTRWVHNIGDPVYTIKAGVLVEGHVIGIFVWKGLRHFVVGNDKGFSIETDPRPHKKSAPLVMSHKG